MGVGEIFKNMTFQNGIKGAVDPFNLLHKPKDKDKESSAPEVAKVEAPDPKKIEEEEKKKLQQKLSRRTQTTFTSPLGVKEQANVLKEQLGQ